MRVFARCQHLEHVSLPTHLKEISVEAFAACGSLCTLALPQQLRHIGHRAFAERSKLSASPMDVKKLIDDAYTLLTMPSRHVMH